MMRKNGLLFVATLVAGVMIFALSGCSALSRLDLPEFPVFPTETVTPSATPRPSPSPTATPKPSATPSPKPSVTPSPKPSADPAPSAVPSPGPTAAPAATPAPAAPAYAAQMAVPTPAPVVVPAAYATPVLTITGQSLPPDMTQRSVFDLSGMIRTDCGSITGVTGTLYHGSGEVAQQTSYSPGTAAFSLAGTVNNDLHFAKLTPDTYVYQIIASAKNGTATAETILVNHAFTVVARESSSGGGTSGSYTARTTDDTDNAAQIWNFFIGEFNNPYAAAAILGNIYTESSCDPQRVEGDIYGDFSQDYTAQVDAGAISRDGFIDYLPGDKYGHGYGLCQWSAERKAGLYDLAVSLGSSVGSLNTQCQFIMQELESEYTTLLEYLKTADDAEAAAFEFCTVYEKAAVHGGRTGYAVDYLEKYAS